MSTVLVLLGSFLVLLLINVPVAFCMSLACVFAFLWKGTNGRGIGDGGARNP